jgi:hypothetical protein
MIELGNNRLAEYSNDYTVFMRSLLFEFSVFILRHSASILGAGLPLCALGGRKPFDAF